MQTKDTTKSSENKVATTTDELDLAWYVDKLVEILVFVGGISAVIFILGIFVFVFKVYVI